MLTIALQGGLGNQIFQWALGKSFENRGHEVQYDTGMFEGDPGRRYMLDQLGLNLKLSHRGGTGQIIQEGSMRYKPWLLDMKGDATLIGYWQCEKYFAEIALPIRMALSPYCSDETLMVGTKISRYIYNSCFVHIRRSDNLRPAGITVHGLLNAPGCTYYKDAMNSVRERVPGVHFFMFSDDPQWCEENMAAPDVTIVGHNSPSFTVDEKHEIHFKAGGREVEDLYLMPLCHHAIIANSTFSYWGAWLGDAQPNRIVIAPEHWFNSLDLDATDIIPERWEKMVVSRHGQSDRSSEA